MPIRVQKSNKNCERKKDYIWNPSACAVAKSYYNLSDTVSVKLNDKKVTCKLDTYYILLYFIFYSNQSLLFAFIV